MAKGSMRMSAEERRESIVRAAMAEFARGGYHGTSTETIARRVGVSQPYLFRLFPNKQAIFLAAADRCVAETRRAFTAAVREEPGLSAHDAMGAAYRRLVHDPDMLLMQLQLYVAVAAAEAAGDHEFGAGIRAAWLELWDQAHLALGGDSAETAGFFAYGMLINVLVALGFSPDHRVWSGMQLPPE
ncbi:TetR/AcrR family transcriptional regulator [Streptomyces sp. NPDC002055]|uniref:TetR/AcrR family transcriptional regulator n=1 Tax=Streptomyces sp. NPDC002055 TaxID=3154534 RepID=UPI0033330636